MSDEKWQCFQTHESIHIRVFTAVEDVTTRMSEKIDHLIVIQSH